MQIQIYYTINSGLFLYYRGCGLLVDGLHEGEKVGMSPFPQTLQNQLENRLGLFSRLNALLFTHLHADHYSAPLAGQLRARLPDALLIAPDDVACPRESAQFTVGPFRIRSFPTVHDGKEYVNTPHDAFLIEAGGERILLPGDASFGEGTDYFTRFCPEGADILFVNPYQMLSAKMRTLLRQWQPDRVFLNHLPYPQDDTYQYRALAQRLLGKWPHDLPVPEEMRPFSWLDGRAPEDLVVS